MSESVFRTRENIAQPAVHAHRFACIDSGSRQAKGERAITVLETGELRMEPATRASTVIGYRRQRAPCGWRWRWRWKTGAWPGDKALIGSSE
jgi:hypothetical protein